MPNSGFDVGKYQHFYTPIAIFLGGLGIAVAIFLTGGLGGSSGVAGDINPSGSGVPSVVEVSVDDDPVLGSADAPVTIIEFSDFECPFCRSFHGETFSRIKEVYIDTGKVKLVYRDLPLPFHDPAATNEAVAANCALEQGGDSVYFEYISEIFTRTRGDGTGIRAGEDVEIAQSLGLDTSAFRSCLSSDSAREEIAGDLADAEFLAGLIGGIGTPTFFIGKSDSSGTIKGQVISGAQPFVSFQKVIDGLLSD